MYILLIASMAAVLVLAACSSTLPETKATDTTGPAIKILVPRDDPEAVGITGEGYCPVLVEVTNFNLTEKLGEANVPGEGHIHYYHDTELLTEACKPSETAAETYADSSETTYFWPQIGAGPHTFTVELVNNDHTPLNPPVIAMARAGAALYWDS